MSTMENEYYESQIAILEHHKLVYVSCTLNYEYKEEEHKFKKSFTGDVGKYKDVKR